MKIKPKNWQYYHVDILWYISHFYWSKLPIADKQEVGSCTRYLSCIYVRKREFDKQKYYIVQAIQGLNLCIIVGDNGMYCIRFVICVQIVKKNAWISRLIDLLLINSLVFTLYQWKQSNKIIGFVATVKPVCSDHLLNKINYLWFISSNVF